MYERHFGITAPPFQLSPDPFFYFDSDQHRAALTAMRQAFSRELPFVVLSGEIGTGKTTILRAWLAEVEAAGITVAQLANTQLDADELMCAIATAFGIAAGSSAGPDAGLRRFLRGLKGRAALLVIDEAQNLDRPALQCLVGLADTAARRNAELRICLAGQPELLARLADPTLPDLQSRVQTSCHLGPLEPAQTRQYIEHRLLKVGWAGKPSFDDAAFDAIHRFTGGVPRRINVLGNRLMLSQFLSSTARVDARMVIATAHALHAEIGEETVIHEPLRTALEPLHIAPIPSGALFLVASGRSDHIKAVPLLYAMGRRRDLPPPVVVSLSDGSPWRLNHDLHAFVGLAQLPVTLVDDAQPMLEHVEVRFGRLVDQCWPGAVIVFDGDPISQCCATVARKQDVPLVHVGADAQGAEEFTDPRSARAAIARIADLRFDCQCPEQGGWVTGESLSLGVGNLLIDAVSLALQMTAQSPHRVEQRLSPLEYMDERRGYGVVALKQLRADARSPCRPEIVEVLRDVSRDLPLVWPMRRATMLAMHGSGVARALARDRIVCIEELGHAGFVRLLRHATCVLTDCLDVLEEAAALGVPCLSLGARHAGDVDAGGWLPGIEEVGSSVTRATRAVWEILFNDCTHMAPPALWDGHAGTRIATHLAHWLAESRERAGALVIDASQSPG